jgi:hypothetical protein
LSRVAESSDIALTGELTLLPSIVKEEAVPRDRIARAANRPRALFERRCWTPPAATFEKAPLRTTLYASGLAVSGAAGWVGVKSHLGSAVRGRAGHAVSPHGQPPLSKGRRGSQESRGARPLLRWAARSLRAPDEPNPSSEAACARPTHPCRGAGGSLIACLARWARVSAFSPNLRGRARNNPRKAQA